MAKLWTKNGRPLSRDGNDVYTAAGTLIGRIHGDRVFGAKDGGYVGTLVDDRLVFRTYDVDGPYRAYTRQASDSLADTVPPSRTWGDEPILPN
ncbi:MAG TPA: hypothetical protein VHC18_15870 [Amycolatopsis sp.]|nr:hypothetical protein [Amycolatopsis sp.]